MSLRYLIGWILVRVGSPVARFRRGKRRMKKGVGWNEHHLPYAPFTVLRREDLERLGLLDLVVLCGKFAADPSIDPVARENACRLRRRWASLQRSPLSNLTEEQEREAELEALRQEVIDLLVALCC